ncbi:MAG: helix-turn-helix transcriptional regulator [Sphingomonadales bacterium]|nr:helix-turn-helix transcriptional regulator [Sphingomonadales bacterium]
MAVVAVQPATGRDVQSRAELGAGHGRSLDLRRTGSVGSAGAGRCRTAGGAVGRAGRASIRTDRLLDRRGTPVGVTTTLPALRGEKGLTQAALASAVGVSRQTINSIENGRFEPSLTLALVLARHFELPVEAIFALDVR